MNDIDILNIDTVSMATELNLSLIAMSIRCNMIKNIVVMTGAGISVSAGIPDFRTPGIGLYDNLQKYNLPEPQAIFDLEYFKENPRPFYTLAKELFPTTQNRRPTVSHYFLKLLLKKGLLLRNYSQNIDGLEFLAGLPEDKVVQAHGGFQTAKCINCKKPYDGEFVKQAIFSNRIPYCEKCHGYVKPDIVFFTEDLPERFSLMKKTDFRNADLLIVMGTSLAVEPFASLITNVNQSCPRILINRERVFETDAKHENYVFVPPPPPPPPPHVDHVGQMQQYNGGGDSNSDDDMHGFNFKWSRDSFIQGECDQGVWKFVELLGWKEELQNLIRFSDQPK